MWFFIILVIGMLANWQGVIKNYEPDKAKAGEIPIEAGKEDVRETLEPLRTEPKEVESTRVENDLVSKTQKYIETYFYPKENSSIYCKNTLVKAKEWVDIAQANNFPLDLLIVQAHLESHGGTCGRANISNNVHNVNNTDAGDNMPITVCGVYTECLDNWLAGEQKFINLIKVCYTQEGKQPSLIDFINQDFRIQQTVPPFCSAKAGSRYMTDSGSKAKYLETYEKFKAIFN
jgi:hypothetical protein